MTANKTRNRRTLSIRTTLTAMAIVVAVYVVAFVSETFLVIVPAANVLRGEANDLLAQHAVVRARLQTLRESLVSITGSLDARTIAGQRTLDAERERALTDPIKARLDSVVAMRASLRSGHATPALRLSLAQAVESETSAGLAMLDAVRARQSGSVERSEIELQRAKALLDSTSLHLESAQGAAIAELVAREDRLHQSIELVLRWSLAWAAIAATISLLMILVVRHRVYGPIDELEKAVARVAGGDLKAEARVANDDELGRLASHFNAMTEVLRDRVSEQTRRHESLTERFGRILDESSNEIYLIDALSLRFVQANRGALSNLGYTMEELSALSPTDVLRDVHEQSFRSSLDALRNGEQASFILSGSQARKDGSLYPVEIRLQFSESGDSPVFVAVVDDVSERGRARELNDQLRRFAMAEQRLIGGGDLVPALCAINEMAGAALQVARTSVWLYNPDRLVSLDVYDQSLGAHTAGQEIKWSEQRAYLASIRKGELIAAHDAARDPRTEVLIAGVRPDVGAQLDVPVRAAGRLTAFVTYEHVGGARRWSAEEQTFASSVADLIALAIEAAERSRLEVQLANVQKMDSIGRLAGGVAHDFNNLLTAIVSYVELAQLQVPADHPVRDDLVEIGKAAGRATELTRQLLTFARHQVVQARVLDVNALTRRADKLLRRLLREDIPLVTLLAPDLGATLIDPGQFEQVILNLAVNAREAMPDGGRLTIETRNVTVDEDSAAQHAGATPGEYIEIAVSDTGHGMDRETLDRLFEPFFTTKEQGTGLGLAICYGIVRQAGGIISADSKPGRGSTFRVLLPRVNAPVERDATADTPAATPRGSETILLVEDEEQIRALTTRVLKAQGYTVLTAGDGEEALAIARDQLARIDVLVTDVVMPLLGGRDLASRLRQERPDLPVMYMSGYTRGVIPDAELQDEGTDFMSKPFAASELVRRIRRLLDRPTEPSVVASVS